MFPSMDEFESRDVAFSLFPALLLGSISSDAIDPATIVPAVGVAPLPSMGKFGTAAAARMLDVDWVGIVINSLFSPSIGRWSL